MIVFFYHSFTALLWILIFCSMIRNQELIADQIVEPLLNKPKKYTWFARKFTKTILQVLYLFQERLKIGDIFQNFLHTENKLNLNIIFMFESTKSTLDFDCPCLGVLSNSYPWKEPALQFPASSPRVQTDQIDCYSACSTPHTNQERERALIILKFICFILLFELWY